MDCEKVSLLIEEFHDGELNGDLKNLVERHIAGCFSCHSEFERVTELDKLLEKSSVPVPSAIFDQKLMRAFKQKRVRNLESDSSWRQIFLGSVSIPKPILGAAAILMMLAVVGANLIGRNATRDAFDVAANSPIINASSPAIEAAVQTKFVEVPATKIVEVPAIKERVVERIVYVDRPRDSNKRNENAEQNGFTQNTSAAKSRYFVATSLKGFQPLPEIKTEIIKEENTNEK